MSEDLHKIESKSGRAVSYKLGYIVTIIMPEAKPPLFASGFFLRLFPFRNIGKAVELLVFLI